jgi:hypothetical protein
MRQIPDLQGWFNIQKQIAVFCDGNSPRRRRTTHDHISQCIKSSDPNQHFIMIFLLQLSAK